MISPERYVQPWPEEGKCVKRPECLLIWKALQKQLWDYDPVIGNRCFLVGSKRKALLPVAGAGLSSSNEPMVISNINHIKLHIRVYVCIIVDAVDTEPEQLEELILVQLIIGDIKQVFGRNLWP